MRKASLAAAVALLTTTIPFAQFRTYRTIDRESGCEELADRMWVRECRTAVMNSGQYLADVEHLKKVEPVATDSVGVAPQGADSAGMGSDSTGVRDRAEAARAAAEARARAEDLKVRQEVAGSLKTIAAATTFMAVLSTASLGLTVFLLFQD